ncbi:hypothetical protein GOP47_0024199 [Adiantum capillus-veneris]|uniref:C2H2-type domain-containing protein n=1 Tax=Adiantum capillus-veneris TaxID=13818 RepID=A0A9D4U718_ADICA|nr:hypothetical protein GOP47_0024199 [Adiantum capillus-veneris]
MSASDHPSPPIHKLDHELHSRPCPELFLHRSNVQPCKPPLKLPHKRKFFTLSMYNSADSDVDSSRNSPASDAGIAWNRSSAQNHYQDALDLGAISAVSRKLDMAMEGGSSSSCLAGEEQILEKKKLLAQLTGMAPGAGKTKAFNGSTQTFHGSSKGYRESSAIMQTNPCKVCKYCGREFPSGRALGGHMRVHGALLDEQLSNMKQERQSQQYGGKQLYAEMQKRQELSRGSKAQNGVASDDLSALKDCENRYQPTLDNRALEDCREETGSQLFLNIQEKLDVNCTTPTPYIKEKEEREDRSFDVSYSSLEYSASYGGDPSKMGIHGNDENVSKKNIALYELRRNPKPNYRFMSREEHLQVAQTTNPFNANCHSTGQSTPEPPSSLTAEDMVPNSHSAERAHPCSECSKVFPSWKSLFGHMRCHPEREWRGIQRPDGTGELDRMAARVIAQRPPSADGSTELEFDQPHQNKSDCMKVEIAEIAPSDVRLDLKELQANHSKSKCINKKELIYSILQAEEKGASTANGKAQMLPAKVSLEVPANDLDCTRRHNGGQQANKNQSSNYKLQESMTHSNVEAMADEWSPSWSNAGKRSKRRRVPHMHTEPHPLTSDQTTSDQIKMDQRGSYDAGDYNMEDLVDPANCLVLLSKSMPAVNKSSTGQSALCTEKVWRAIANVERAWDDAIQNRMRQHDDYEAEDDNVDDDDNDDDDGDEQAVNNGGHVPPTLSVKYQCSTCKKCFNSHQALGGHRASHRKMKGCFARTKSLASYDAQESSEENNTDEPEYSLSFFYKKGKIVKRQSQSSQERKGNACKDLADKSEKKFKGHECSICHRVFVTGQALGGHKRCHWTGEKVQGVSDAASVASSSSTENRQQTSTVQEKEAWVYQSDNMKPKDIEVFDLNLPAPMDEDDEVGLEAAPPACGASLRPDQMWKQQETWYPTKVAHIPQVCSVKTTL